jgi:hypothetical protein
MTRMTDNGEDQADGDQDDPDRDQDRQLRHEKTNHEQNDAEDNHAARPPRHTEANMSSPPLDDLSEGQGHRRWVRDLPVRRWGRCTRVRPEREEELVLSDFADVAIGWVSAIIAGSSIRPERSIGSWPTRAGMQERRTAPVGRSSALAEQLSSYAASSRSKKERYRRRPRLRSSVDTSSPLAHRDSS